MWLKLGSVIMTYTNAWAPIFPYYILHMRLIPAAAWMRNWHPVEWVVQCQRDGQSQNMAQVLWSHIPWTCYNALVLLSRYAPGLCVLEYMVWLWAVFLGEFLQKAFTEYTLYVRDWTLGISPSQPRCSRYNGICQQIEYISSQHCSSRQENDIHPSLYTHLCVL